MVKLGYIKSLYYLCKTIKKREIMKVESIKIKIFDIEWSGEDADQVPTEFTIEEDLDVIEEYVDDEGELDMYGFVQEWLEYNGSKWGVTPEDFDFTDLVD